MGVCIPNARNHAKIRESVAPTSRTTPKRGSRMPNLKGHVKAWECVSPTQGTTPKGGSLYPQFKEPRQSVGVGIPNLTDPTKAWDTV